MKRAILCICTLIKSLPGFRKSALEYFVQGNAKIEQQDYKGAFADYTKAIIIDPNYANAYCQRGKSKIDLMDYHGAIADFTKAIEFEPKFIMAYYFRGNMKILLRDSNGAIDDFTKAVEIPLLAKGGYFGDVATLLK